MLRIDKNDFYNGEAKVRYLETFEEENTAYITSFMFKKTAETEEDLKKDLYDMTKIELEYVIKGLSASTVNSAYIKAVQLEQYIDWAIENGYVESNLNPLSNFNKREWVMPFVATYKQLAFTRKEILKFCNEEIYNWVDKAVLLAIFEGIRGEGYAELLNLMEKDLHDRDGKYTADLTDKDGSERTIEISEELYDFLKRTSNEMTYYNKNGETTGDRWSNSALLDSPYIFKKSTRGKQEGKLDLMYINRKFQIYKEVLDMKYLRSRHIENSGMMHMANELFNRDGYYKPEHLEEIAIQYGTGFNKVGGKDERVTTVIKTLLKSETFEQLYGYKLI